MTEPLELKPLHPRAARPALERLLAQAQAQEPEHLARLWNESQAGAEPTELSPRALELIQGFRLQADRDGIVEKLVKELMADG